MSDFSISGDYANNQVNKKNELKFKTSEELNNSSIFLSDDNNKVEISDIQGNKFQALIDLLREYIIKRANWTQELINKVEELIVQHNQEKEQGTAEEEIVTDSEGWTVSKKDENGTIRERMNNNGDIETYDDKGILLNKIYTKREPEPPKIVKVES